MKKILLISIIGLGLLGCGGGGSSDTSYTEKPTDSGINSNNFDSFTTFNWGSIQFKTGFVEIIKNMRNSNILYTNYQKLEPNNIELYKRHILSKDGLYRPDPTNYQLGYRTFNINYVSKDGNVFRKTPYNLNQLKDLQIQEQGQWVALDNITVSDRAAVYWNILADQLPSSVWFDKGERGTQFKKFLALSKVTRFPSGAKCFKSEKTTYSMPFFVITAIGSNAYVNGQNVKTFDEFLKAAGTNKVSGTWGGISWAYLKEYDQPKYYVADIVANIDGKLSVGYWEKDPNTTLQKTLKEYENMLQQPYVSQEDRISFNAAIEEVKYECTYFNDIAANTIEKLIDQSISN